MGKWIRDNTLYQSNLLFGNARILIFPKMFEHFEFIDKINQTGYLHVVDAVFTTDETLLCRAEAYAMKKDYDNAVKDINTWIVSHTMTANGTAKRPTMTVESIKTLSKACRMHLLHQNPIWSIAFVRHSIHRDSRLRLVPKRIFCNSSYRCVDWRPCIKVFVSLISSAMALSSAMMLTKSLLLYSRLVTCEVRFNCQMM